jgi:hypothetical protein
VSDSCTVLIASADLLPALKERAATERGEVLAFTDADALKAFEAIIRRRPNVVALERLFAATPRGAALINRIKQDPALANCEIRVVSHETEYTRVSPRRPADPPAGAAAAVASAPQATTATASAVSPAQPLDYRGTRRAPRHAIAGNAPVMVDGNQAALVNLSILGAQVLSPSVLKPNQRVRVALNDDAGSVRFNASVAWASFEIPPKGGPRYRAGIEFIDADQSAVEAYCSRHKDS